jgi:intracellular multiplication protein IcmO
MIAAAQDVEMLTSGSRAAEAGAMLANQNIQVYGKLGDAGKTADLYQKALGQVTVALKRDYKLGAFGYARTSDIHVEKIDRAGTNDLRAMKAGEAFITFGGVVRRMKWFYMGDDNKANRVPYFQINRFLQIEPPTTEEIMAHSVPMEQLNDPYRRGTQLVKRLSEPVDAFEYVKSNAVISAIAQAAGKLPANLPAQERGIALYMAAREALLRQRPVAPAAAGAPPTRPTAPPEQPERENQTESAGASMAVDPVSDPNEPVDDPLAFLSGGNHEPTFARKKASEVIGLGSSGERAQLIQQLEGMAGQQPERNERAPAALPADPFEAMLTERTVTYRMKDDILRSRGRIIAELVSAPQDLVDPVTGTPVDSRPDWIGDAVLDAQKLGHIQPAADDTVVGMTDRTLERVQDAERALGSPDPAAAAKSAEQVVAARVTAPTSARAPIDDLEVDAAMKVLTL